EQQVEDVVVSTKAKRKSDDFALSQQRAKGQLRPGGRGWFVRVDLRNKMALRIAQFGIFFRLAIHPPEEQQIQQADRTRRCEAPAPAYVYEKNAQQWHADGRSQLGRRIRQRGGKASLMLRKPGSDSICIRWKSGPFAH